MAEVIIRLLDLPYETKGFTAVDGNGDYNLYLNARYNHETQRTAYDHEMVHIDQEHFFSDTDVVEDEQEADDLKPISTQPQSNPQPEQSPEYPVFSPALVPQVTSTPPDKPDYAKLRAATGYTAWQVSKFVGISTGRYVRIEQGLTQPMPQEKIAIEQFLVKKGE